MFPTDLSWSEVVPCHSVHSPWAASLPQASVTVLIYWWMPAFWDREKETGSTIHTDETGRKQRNKVLLGGMQCWQHKDEDYNVKGSIGDRVIGIHIAQVMNKGKTPCKVVFWISLATRGWHQFLIEPSTQDISTPTNIPCLNCSPHLTLTKSTAVLEKSQQ